MGVTSSLSNQEKGPHCTVDSLHFPSAPHTHQVLLSNMDGLHTKAQDPIPAYCPELHQNEVDMSCGVCPALVCENVASKIDCAWTAAQKGIPTLILNGKGTDPAILRAVRECYLIIMLLCCCYSLISLAFDAQRLALLLPMPCALGFIGFPLNPRHGLVLFAQISPLPTLPPLLPALPSRALLGLNV